LFGRHPQPHTREHPWLDNGTPKHKPTAQTLLTLTARVTGTPNP